MVILIDQRAHRFTAGAAAPAYRGVVGQVCNAILSGELKVGDRLCPERLRAEQCGLSRSTLREAIRILTQAGILTVRRGVTGGAFVACSAVSQNPLASALELTRAELLERLEARTLLKLPIVEFAARATPAEVTLLEQVLGQLAVVDGARGRFMEADTQFHLGLARAAHNVPLYRVFQDLFRRLLPVFDMLPLSGGSIRLAGSRTGRRCAPFAAAARPPRTAMERHLSYTERSVEQLFKSGVVHLGRQEAGAAYSTAISATTI